MGLFGSGEERKKNDVKDINLEGTGRQATAAGVTHGERGSEPPQPPKQAAQAAPPKPPKQAAQNRAEDDVWCKEQVLKLAESMGMPTEEDGNGGRSLRWRTVYGLLASASQEVGKYKDKCKAAQARVRELEAYVKQSGGDVGYKAWRAAQRKGRECKPIDWAKYDRLKTAGVTEKDIAKYLKVSPNTLRARVKERKGAERP